MRIASAIVFALVALLFAGWWGWVRAPGPAEVCGHLVELTTREVQAQGLDPATEGRLIEATGTQCMQRAADKLKLRGRLGYARWAKCIANAETVAAAGHC